MIVQNINYRFLFAVLISVSLCSLASCSLHSEEDAAGREKEIQQCEDLLLALDKKAFRFPKMRRCICEKKIDKFQGDELEACDANCLMAYSLLDRKLFAGEDFTRCICAGVRLDEEPKALWDKCSTKFPDGTIAPVLEK